MRSLKLIIAGLAITLGAINSAQATPISFNLNTPDSRDDILDSNSTYAMQYNYEEEGLGLAVTGWSYGQECTKTRRGKCTNWLLNESIEQDYVGKWDGLGVEVTDSPNHAVDNEIGDYDMHLLSFDELVKLTTLDLGWFENDSDISILAFNGSSFDQSSLLGKQWQDLIGNDWQLVGNYYNVDYGTNSGAVNFDGITSQYWLVGAYNENFGDVFSGSNKNKSNGNDYYKLKGVTVERPPVEVPETNSLILLMLGLAGLVVARRRSV
ncbi:exosortase-dependent surface protein XDP1 [Cellvibrio sp. UBA7661]|uniref:exosortase-dependent surface protein XDP1 n=1 Tax=Cellvibrio sp. UBA7661 TaxID=1946311 RepID=UPI002F355DA9